MTTSAEAPAGVPEEDHSTGTAWRAPAPEPRPATDGPGPRPWTPEEQAQHWADLAEAIDGYVVGRPLRAEDGGRR
ncbi:hypothetical protein EF913_28440 [Streptomyces sp. WAC04189]|uniref:hypothetical protein n=1 Tax=Streptomyces sp. WAC04189 TaxID=2487411 RepID=UPI000FAA6C23|nr:hypothetical protein [Streptomyces sp. WAC04189]RSR98061.1 hypothetical protein EF913_28440 [Streptomyces sp. WAC04189]